MFPHYERDISRQYNVAFREHHNDYKYAYSKSNSVLHLLNESHVFDPTNDIMDIVHFARKGYSGKILHLRSDTKRESNK